MAIWNEIKRSINSNLSKPLNELIGESSDNTTVMDKLDTLINNSGNSSGGNVQYMKSPLEYIFDHRHNDLPYIFVRSSAVVYNNEIHILGSGSANTTYYTTHYKWNGSSWSSVSTLPYNFFYGSAVVYNNEIHILGSGNSTYYKYHYKWNGTSWSSVSTLPYNFYQGSAVVYNDEIHILGGPGGNTFHYKWNGSSWSSVSTLPYGFIRGSAVVYNDEIHIMGTNIGSSYSTYHYKWDGSSWSSVSNLPYAFISGSAVVYDDEIHILGSSSSGYYKYHYKWNGSSWSSVSNLPYEFYMGSAVVYNDEIHILGSNYSSYTSKFHYMLSSMKTPIQIVKPSIIYTIKTTMDPDCVRISDNSKVDNNSNDINGDIIIFNIDIPGLYYIITNNPFVIVTL